MKTNFKAKVRSYKIYRRSKEDNNNLDAVTKRLKAICENGG